MSPTPSGHARNGTARIAYDDLGGTGGEPLLLVMGTAVTRFWWPAGFVAELIGRGFHVVSYDNRDSGQSTFFPAAKANPIGSLFRRRAAAYTAEDLTYDAVAVMNAVGWDSAHLFGHSMGGLTAQRIAMLHPERVRTLASSAAVPSDAGRWRVLRYIRPGLIFTFTRLRFPETVEGDQAFSLAVSRALASPGYPFDEREALSRIDKDVACAVRDLAAQGRQLGAKWSSGRLDRLRLPTVVFHGEADPLLRTAAARDLAAAIAGARLISFPGVGHDLPKALWPRYAEELRDLATR